ncbi:MAG: hypothetical protein VCD31_11005 [Alphaproteobacteria bacterium]
MRKRGQMTGRKMAGAILHNMKMLNQQIAAPRPVADQGLNFSERFGLNLAAFSFIAGAPRAFAGMAEFPNAALCRRHRYLPVFAMPGVTWQKRDDL